MKTAMDPSRAVLRVEGDDAEQFLQGLLTNDVAGATGSAGVYAALLTPQGKLIADMILWRPAPERFLIDVAEIFTADLLKRLTLYKLRAAVEITPAPDLRVRLYWRDEAASDAPEASGLAGGEDPRLAELGWRFIEDVAAAAEPSSLEAWERLRVSLGVPASGSDLRANDAYPLEYSFERLNGVDFKKGCFVGQEIIARMKHKAELKKGLFRVTLDGPAPEPGAEVQSDGKPAGTIGSVAGETGLAHLRFDRAEGAMTVGETRIVKAERV